MSKRNRSYRCLPRWVEWAIGLGILVTLAVILNPWGQWPEEREKARRMSCVSNLKQISQASLLYASDHDGHFVPQSGWDDALRANLFYWGVFHCPQDRRQNTLSYAMSPDVAGLSVPTGEYQRDPPWGLILPDDAATVVAFYDGIGTMVIERHQDGAYYAFMDGHVKWLEEPPEDSRLFVREEERR